MSTNARAIEKKGDNFADFDNSEAWYDRAYGVNGWHDADYCGDGDCDLGHRHTADCRCPDCNAFFDEDE